MFDHRPRDRGQTSRVFRQAPRTLIRRIIATSRLDRADHRYRQAMAVIDAALFTRPDYAELRN
ncbi:MAG: hypothetical protein GEV09_23280, partial [Pseudonocardiaceae bacterium]|nr:hypothetical protein [Pseudonocardiaceae bacterium]